MLLRIEETASFTKYYALACKQAVRMLRQCPGWETKAEDGLQKARTVLLEALQDLETAICEYEYAKTQARTAIQDARDDDSAANGTSQGS